MTSLDDRWRVPADYDVDLDAGGRVLRHRGQPGAPALNLLSYLEVERLLAEPGPYSALAWQLAADADDVATELVMSFVDGPTVDRVICAHVMQVAADPEQRGVQVAKLAWRDATDEQRVGAGLMLVTSAQLTAEKASPFLDKIEPGLAHATPVQRATFALIRASLTGSAALLDDAHRQFAELDHALGLAQCALVAYQHEQAGPRRPELLRAYLEHAIYRYDVGRRDSWAARTITYALVPLLVDAVRAEPTELADWLQRAVAFAASAQSADELRGAFRTAAKLGFDAALTTLEPSDPPQFTRRAGWVDRRSSPIIAPVAAAPAAAPAAEEPPAKKKKSKGKGKAARA